MYIPLNKDKRCTGENNGCCTVETPCDLGEGDCDSDNQCHQGLKCGSDNCSWGGWGDDCCELDPNLVNLP